MPVFKLAVNRNFLFYRQVRDCLKPSPDSINKKILHTEIYSEE